MSLFTSFDGFILPPNVVSGFIRPPQRLYDEGLPELAAGNRQVWQLNTGEFYQLRRPSYLVESFFYVDCHERGAQQEPYPPKIERLNQLRIAAKYRGDNMLFPPHNGVCHIFDPGYLLKKESYNLGFYTLPYPVFPKDLPSVPERSDIIIKTGEPVPCDGICEPVKIQYQHKFLAIVTITNPRLSRV